MRLACAVPLLTLLLVLCALEIRGHGRLRVPPSRASMWRDGFNSPINYDDNELFCGGNWYQNGMNGGKCGVCGDPWGKPDPEYEAGGKYAMGIITRTYTEGQEIGIAVEVTSQHGGFFEFRICPNNDIGTPATHECLNRNMLPLADGSGYRLYMGINDPVGFYNTTLRLPTGLSCTQCVLQWKWHTGNSWGTDDDGHSCIGCGAQEEFYGCSDVAVRPRDLGVVTPSPSQNIPTVTTPRTIPPTVHHETTTTPRPAAKPSTIAPATTACVPAAGYEGNANVARLCLANCNQNCPSDLCRCGSKVVTRKVCKTTNVGPWKNANLDDWCASRCASGDCPLTHCMCVEIPA